MPGIDPGADATAEQTALAGRGPEPSSGRWNPLRFLFKRCLWDQWVILNREAAAERAASSRSPAIADAGWFDARVLVVLAVAAASLALQEYFGDRETFVRLSDAALTFCQLHLGLTSSWTRHVTALRFGPFFELGGYVYWAAARVIGYVVLPALAILWLPGVRLRDCGLSLRGAHRHLWIYAALYLGVLPLIIAASYRPPFLATYPFYRNVSRSGAEFLVWELAYFAQFFSLELFFRGYLLHPLKRSLGAYAIFASAVPYCMIHFGKPLPETLGAIVAGVVLGTLSLRTRSIWAGVLIHISVALTMDLLALSHTGAFPHVFWPHVRGL